ncbi:recombinase family protein [Candidatus Poriferisodalis sp.]|uniref:recombinase family protein n=1 Tax=Candidatus Poriferisodalis sp. TaxID=3101277 RepID=UPI003B59809D
MNKQLNELESKRIISYARVSTGAQATSGLGIEAQHRAVRDAAVERGWQIVDYCTDDAVSASIEPKQRPQLGAALARLDAREADVIVAVRLDRLIRSLRDLQTLLDLSAEGGWEFIGLDIPVNSDLPVGSFLRSVIGAFNELERALISERTKSALAVMPMDLVDSSAAVTG